MKNENRQQDLSKYQLTSKELKKLNKELRKIINMPLKKLIRFLRKHPI